MSTLSLHNNIISFEHVTPFRKHMMFWVCRNITCLTGSLDPAVTEVFFANFIYYLMFGNYPFLEYSWAGAMNFRDIFLDESRSSIDNLQ